MPWELNSVPPKYSLSSDHSAAVTNWTVHMILFSVITEIVRERESLQYYSQGFKYKKDIKKEMKP